MMVFLVAYTLLFQCFAEVQEYKCDVDVVGKICLDNGELQLSLPYDDQDIFGYWSFDYDKYIDQSSKRHITKRNHIESTYSANGFGLAALINHTSQLDVYLVPGYNFQKATISFIIYFDDLITIHQAANSKQKEQEIQFCGIMNLLEKEQVDDPSQKILRIGFDCFSRNIIVQFITNQKKENLIQSKMRVQPQMWYQIHLIMTDTLQLYVNGYAEGSAQMKNNKGLFNHLLIGTILNQDNSKCSLNFIIDSLRLIKNPLQKSFIYASAQQFNAYADLLILGCTDCPYKQAKQCVAEYHLCSSLELYSYAISVSKDMGWAQKLNVNFWSQDTNLDVVETKQLGIGLCCRNIVYA